jgi:hypothetical protein
VKRGLAEGTVVSTFEGGDVLKVDKVQVKRRRGCEGL